MYGEDVGMIEIGYGARFLGKALQTILIFSNFGRQDLERHSAAEFRSVLRQINLTHPARAKFGDDAVVRQSGVGWQFFRLLRFHSGTGRLCPSGLKESTGISLEWFPRFEATLQLRRNTVCCVCE